MAEIVKVEDGVDFSQQVICHGCLSQDRKTSQLPSGELRQAFCFIISPQTYMDPSSTKLCWECTALLKRLSRFRSQVLQAHTTLMQMYYLNPNYSLSKLTKTTKADFDQKYEYIPALELETVETFVTTDTKPIKIEVVKEEVEKEVALEKESGEDVSNVRDDDDFDNPVFDSDDEPLKMQESVPKKPKKNKNVPYNFIQHAIVKESDTNWAKAKDISKYFTDEYLDEDQVEEHVMKMERMSKPRFLIKCKVCKNDYSNKPDFLRHQNLNHREPDAPNNCLLCKNEFPTLEQLKQHWKHTHSCYSKCNMCLQYCRKRAQKKHLKYAHTKLYCCGQCGEQMFTPKLFNVHYKEKHATFICQVCSKMFHYERTLVRHMEMAHRSLTCKYCDKSFKKAQYLSKHMVAFHANELNLNTDNESAYCVECDRNFISVARLKDHLKYSVKHVPPKPPKQIPCPECGKIFSRRIYMTNHLKCAHMKEKEHVCSYCCKFFTTNGSLKRHYDEVHLKIPKVKDKICDFCGEAFAEKRTLAKHCRRAHAFVPE